MPYVRNIRAVSLCIDKRILRSIQGKSHLLILRTTEMWRRKHTKLLDNLLKACRLLPNALNLVMQNIFEKNPFVILTSVKTLFLLFFLGLAAPLFVWPRIVQLW